MSPSAGLRSVVALALSAVLAGTVVAPADAAVEPPFDGTIFLDPDIITAADPTTFTSIEYVGQGIRSMFDRRTNSFVAVDAHLFAVDFRDGLDTEVQVNPEFDQATAQALAEEYAPVVGQLPTVLRKDVHAVWVQGGNQLFGGGNNSLLIHTEQADAYEAAGILEETLVHEAAHTSLDAEHSAAPGWLAAQQADPDVHLDLRPRLPRPGGRRGELPALPGAALPRGSDRRRARADLPRDDAAPHRLPGPGEPRARHLRAGAAAAVPRLRGRLGA